jgi:acyl carrier protein
MTDDLKKINAIFKTVFNKTMDISPKTSKNDVAEWDSLNHLSLILELESEFQLGLTPDEIETIKSVEDILNAIQSRK